MARIGVFRLWSSEDGVDREDDAREREPCRGVTTGEGVCQSFASPGAPPRVIAGTPPGVVTTLVCR